MSSSIQELSEPSPNITDQEPGPWSFTPNLGRDPPDLLYALRLYLTGDVGANAIRVTGVNDGEDD